MRRGSSVALGAVSAVLILFGLGAAGVWVCDSLHDEPVTAGVTVHPVNPAATPFSTAGWWQTTPSPSPTMTEGGLATATAAWSTTWSPSPSPTPLDLQGKILFKTRRDRLVEYWYMDPDGTNQIKIPWERRDTYCEARAARAFSPDGRYLVFVGASADIYVQETSSGNSWQLTFDTLPSYDPAISSDGHWIAFVSQEGEGGQNDEIWIIDKHGDNRQQLTFTDWEWNKFPSWSPDGSKIVFWSNRTGTSQVYVMNRDGTALTQVTFVGANWDPVWLRDTG
jgi:Tol biopolymer transport system component